MAVLRIYNPIMSEEDKMMNIIYAGTDGVCFKDIDDFISSIPPNDNAIDVRLHCPGGSTSEGWAIYDKLRASGKEITATAEGDVASMATILLLAAPKGSRFGYPSASLCIHEPYIREQTLVESYRADDLHRIANDLSSEIEKFINLYTERTGADREVISALMKEDKCISMEEAKRLGFISEIKKPISACKKTPNNFQMSREKKQTVAEAMKSLWSALNLSGKIVALELNTESGTTLSVDTEDQEPAVGDPATPDGEHVMPDGRTIIVVDGVITEIKDPSEEIVPEVAEDTNSGELQTLMDQIVELERRIEVLESEKSALKTAQKTDAEKRVLQMVAVAGGEDWLKKNARSNRSPTNRTPQGNTLASQAPLSEVAKRLEALKKAQ